MTCTPQHRHELQPPPRHLHPLALVVIHVNAPQARRRRHQVDQVLCRRHQQPLWPDRVDEERAEPVVYLDPRLRHVPGLDRRIPVQHGEGHRHLRGQQQRVRPLRHGGVRVVGYFFQRYGFPVAPVVLGLIFGPKLETHLRRALIISRGDWSIFLQRPITAFLLAAVLVYLALPAIVWVSKRAARGPSGLWTVRAEATPR